GRIGTTRKRATSRGRRRSRRGADSNLTLGQRSSVHVRRFATEEVELLSLHVSLPENGRQPAHVVPHEAIEGRSGYIYCSSEFNEARLQLTIVRFRLPIFRK